MIHLAVALAEEWDEYLANIPSPQFKLQLAKK